MTDVMTYIRSGYPIINNGVIVGVTVLGYGSQSSGTQGHNDVTPISGVGSVTTNGYLDTRFDDPTYYG
jgi:hypothetical protein